MGYPLEQNMRRLSIPVYDENSPLALMPERPWWSLAENAARTEGISDLGLRIGESIPFSEIRTLAPQLGACVTLNELLETLCQIVPLQSSHCRFDLAKKESAVWLCDVGPSLLYDRDDCAQLRLYRLLGMIQVVQMALGDNWRPKVVTLPMRYNREVANSDLIGAKQVLFDQPHSAIEIPRTLLNQTLYEQQNSSMEPAVLDRLPKDFAAALVEAIAFHLSQAVLDVDTAAEICGLTTRTLQRKLSEQGTSFRKLVDQTRYLKARDLLFQSEASLSEIGYQLGYSDYTKFSRAFNRWTGQTPRQYRQAAVA